MTIDGLVYTVKAKEIIQQKQPTCDLRQKDWLAEELYRDCRQAGYGLFQWPVKGKLDNHLLGGKVTPYIKMLN